MKYECICGYVYEEDSGEPSCDVESGTKWENLPDGFTCPICGAGKDGFTKIV